MIICQLVENFLHIYDFTISIYNFDTESNCGFVSVSDFYADFDSSFEKRAATKSKTRQQQNKNDDDCVNETQKTETETQQLKLKLKLKRSQLSNKQAS